MKAWLPTLLSAVVLWPIAVAANTCIAPKPLPVVAVCGQVHDPAGALVPNVTLQLMDDQRAVVSEARADADGNFSFARISKGKYLISTSSDGWMLSWPIKVTTSKIMKTCKQPLYVKLGLMSCQGGVGKKGYHDKW